MNIIDKVQNEAYKEWIVAFVRKVFEKAKIKYTEIIIDDIDTDRIYLLVDGAEYDIRTWNFRTVHRDITGLPDSENVDYSLFKTVVDHGEEIVSGTDKITWTNH